MDTPHKPESDKGTGDYEFYRGDIGSEARKKEDEFLKSVGVIGGLRRKADRMGICPGCHEPQPVGISLLTHTPFIQSHYIFGPRTKAA